MGKSLLDAFNAVDSSTATLQQANDKTHLKKRKRTASQKSIKKEPALKKTQPSNQYFYHEDLNPTNELPLPLPLPLPTFNFPGLSTQKNKQKAYSPRNIPIHVKQSLLITHFKEGDLVYGLKNERKPYTDYLAAKHLQQKNTIENFFNHHYFFDTNPESFEKNTTLSPKKEDYQDFIFDHPRYNPNMPGGKGHDEEPQIRRSCKAGIEYVLTKGGTIHFLLDKIKMRRVFTKQYNKPLKNGGFKTTTDLSFTASELRYMYRHQHELATLPGQVVFYNQGKVCEAPWKTDAAKWEETFGASRKLEKEPSTASADSLYKSNSSLKV